MSRTDFGLRIAYCYNRFELDLIQKALIKSAEELIKSKSQDQIANIEKDENLSETEQQTKIDQIISRLETNLSPENVKKRQDEQAKTDKMTAQYLVLNTEKAFNMVLDDLIRFHYKRLEISSSVEYITNVSKAENEELDGDFDVKYSITSREA